MPAAKGWRRGVVREAPWRRRSAFTSVPSQHVLRPLRAVLQDLERSSQPVTPFGFLMQLREKFPQFAQQRNGLYMQQDAEECWTQLLYSLRERLKVPPQTLSP